MEQNPWRVPSNTKNINNFNEMKEKNKLKREEVLVKTDYNRSVLNQTDITKEQMKSNVKPIKTLTQSYFSSPCMLSELEDNEDMYNLEYCNSSKDNTSM